MFSVYHLRMIATGLISGNLLFAGLVEKINLTFCLYARGCETSLQVSDVGWACYTSDKNLLLVHGWEVVQNRVLLPQLDWCVGSSPSRGSCILHVATSLSLNSCRSSVFRNRNECMNGYSSAKHKKDDQKNTMKTHSFSCLSYLNMTVGVLHYSCPHRCILTTPVWSALSDSERREAVKYLNPHNKPECSHHHPSCHPGVSF